MQQKYTPLLIALATLVLLPVVLPALGLTLTTTTDVVIFAIACMGLNILVGHTGLVSFGHGAFFASPVMPPRCRSATGFPATS